MTMTPRREPTLTAARRSPSSRALAPAPPRGADRGAPAGDMPDGLDLRNMSPRQMTEASFDLYVAGLLQREEYALLAFQPELHPDYDRTIGALTGEKAKPDRRRDFIAAWEERLAFERKYNQGDPETLKRTLRIVTLFRSIEAPGRLAA